MPVLQARDCWVDAFGYQRCTRSPWKDWVRWVVLVVIVVGCFLLFAFCSCITARRRRRAGRQPMWGTGWAWRNGHGEPQYYPDGRQQHSTGPPYYSSPHGAQVPPYGAPSTGYHPNPPANDSYDMTNTSTYPPSPQPAYTHDDFRVGGNVYQPPPGPPPGKMDNGIIR